MALTSTAAVKNALLDGSVTIDTMFNGGTLTIRSGAAPGAGNAATGVVLATFAITNTTWVAASNGQRSLFATLTDSSADNSGTAGHFRLANSTYVVEGTVTATGAGGDMELVTTSITAGQPVDLTAVTFTLAH
jgi:hypothetical protein